jgi:hypothetical protein
MRSLGTLRGDSVALLSRTWNNPAMLIGQKGERPADVIGNAITADAAARRIAERSGPLILERGSASRISLIEGDKTVHARGRRSQALRVQVDLSKTAGRLAVRAGATC